MSKRITKSTDSVKKQALFVVLEPQDPDGSTSDLHLDWYDAETIAKACHNFNSSPQRANLMHKCFTNSFSFLESYTAPCDMLIEGENIKKGTWLALIQAEADWVWDAIVSGEFNGLSIQADGLVYDLQ